MFITLLALKLNFASFFFQFNSPYSNQTTNDQRSDPYGQMPSANEQRFHPYGHAPTTATGGVTSGSSSGAGSASSRDRAPNNMSLLQGAIEDLVSSMKQIHLYVRSDETHVH